LRFSLDLAEEFPQLSHTQKQSGRVAGANPFTGLTMKHKEDSYGLPAISVSPKNSFEISRCSNSKSAVFRR
jgi:hypothetical protein